MNELEWLNITEAHDFTGKSPEHIRRCCREGSVEFRKRANGQIEIHVNVLRERFGEKQVAVAA